MKGIILSGGTGSRLYPLTLVVNKQLLHVYDKPMIYYPMSTLIRCGIDDICIISTIDYIDSYKKLFGDGSKLGIKISYKIQEKPRGIAQSFIIAEDFIENESVSLILGDNIFHGSIDIDEPKEGAVVFAYEVNNPSDYGVVEFDNLGNVISIEEKPKVPKSKYAMPGLYFYDNKVVEYSKKLKPSKRGELEITDLNQMYLNHNQLKVLKLPRATAWLDAGSPETLFQSGAYIHSIQSRQGIKIGCIEEETYKQKNINLNQLKDIIKDLPKSEYKEYLQKLTI